MTTKLIYELIPSARVLSRRSYRLAYMNGERKEVGDLSPASYMVLDVVMSLIDEVNRNATFDEIVDRRGTSRRSVAHHLGLLVEAGLLEVMPAQSRLVVVPDEMD